MTITLGGVVVEVAPPPLPAVTSIVPVDLIESVDSPAAGIEIDVPSFAPSITEVPAGPELVLPVLGPRGPGASQFEYLMPLAGTTVFIDHPLGYDPVAVQVFVDDELCDEYTVVYTIPHQQVRIGFDVAVQALIRLM